MSRVLVQPRPTGIRWSRLPSPIASPSLLRNEVLPQPGSPQKMVKRFWMIEMMSPMTLSLESGRSW